MEDSNKNDNNQDECCNYRCILSIIFIIIIISMIKHYFSNFFYLPEDNFLKAINKSWKKHPIMNISLVQKEGFEKMTFMNWNLDKDICDCLYIDDYEDEYEGKCSETLIEDGCNEYNKNNNSTKIYNTTLYVKYYKEDYLSLFKRIRNDKERGKLCKKGYRKCGYLDSLNNPFCKNEGESCPINEIKFFYDKDGKINKIETHNENKNLPVFNQLIVSGIYNATILDIGEFFSLNNINNLERIREPDEIFYSLKLVKNIKYIKSYDFFLENNLIKGKIPKNYKIKNLYLFYSIYTGKKIDNSIISKNILYTFIINRITMSILKIIILLLIIISILVCCYYRPNNKKGLKIFIYIIVIITCIVIRYCIIRSSLQACLSTTVKKLIISLFMIVITCYTSFSAGFIVWLIIYFRTRKITYFIIRSSTFVSKTIAFIFYFNALIIISFNKTTWTIIIACIIRFTFIFSIF